MEVIFKTVNILNAIQSSSVQDIIALPGYLFVMVGGRDCPHGYDEYVGDKCRQYKNCHNMFRCRGILSCVHLGEICDTKSDCVFGDDELNCDLFNQQCPFSCVCTAYSLACEEQNITVHATSKVFPYLLVYLRNSNLSSIKKIC